MRQRTTDQGGHMIAAIWLTVSILLGGGVGYLLNRHIARVEG